MFASARTSIGYVSRSSSTGGSEVLHNAATNVPFDRRRNGRGRSASTRLSTIPASSPAVSAAAKPRSSSTATIAAASTPSGPDAAPATAKLPAPAGGVGRSGASADVVIP